MASEKILDTKKSIVSEISDKLKNNESIIIFSYQGLSVSEMSELRRQLKNISSEVKVYKNTLLKRALNDLDITLDESFLEGPNAIMFGHELLEPIKVTADFAKNHENMTIRVGIINGKEASAQVISDYASIPSYEGLLTMLVQGLMAPVRNLAMVLKKHAEDLENN